VDEVHREEVGVVGEAEEAAAVSREVEDSLPEEAGEVQGVAGSAVVVDGEGKTGLIYFLLCVSGWISGVSGCNCKVSRLLGAAVTIAR